MLSTRIDRRKLVTVATVALLAACKAVPGGGPVAPPPPPPPSSGGLPTDTERHRVALLVPLNGPNAAAGQSIANASTMALLDTSAKNLRITTYDTSGGAGPAATRAIADGNKLILGPLMSDDIPAVVAAARPARVPVVSYSNDDGRASRDVFIMGTLPGQAVARTVGFARSRGLGRFAALVPVGEYGQRTSAALASSVRQHGGTVIAMESYDRSAGSIAAAARRLKAKGGYDAVMIADGPRMAIQAAPVLKGAGGASTRILGTELWSGEAAVSSNASLSGAWYASIADTRWRQFADSYRKRFGGTPYRIATLGYDSVLLTLRVAREWRPGTVFPTGRMTDDGGFLGLDGAFRFRSSGAVERALEVREVRTGGVNIVSPAPAKFED